MSDPGAGLGKVQDKPETFFCARKSEVSKEIRDMSCQMDTEASLKGLPLAKYGTIEAQK